MEENICEKNLTVTSKNGLFHRIKTSLLKLFKRDSPIPETSFEELSTEATIHTDSAFRNYITNIENEDTLLLKLQKQYRNGDISEKDLSQEDIQKLSQLFDSQIATLKKSIQAREQNILKYREMINHNNLIKPT
ncbi:MAG: hypothetical protein FWC79_05145 [Oscillospiraceae bacterium]|nr:hypothetical protein [Oscillospiraceae bacterium]